jgi:hypothetical protein
MRTAALDGIPIRLHTEVLKCAAMWNEGRMWEWKWPPNDTAAPALTASAQEKTAVGSSAGLKTVTIANAVTPQVADMLKAWADDDDDGE